MDVYLLNPKVTAFYFGGDAQTADATPLLRDDWVYDCCDSLGMAVYAIHNGDAAIVYDTLCSPQQAGEVKSFLEKKLGITKFTVVLSHWHLGHVGGNELYQASGIVACRKTREELVRHSAHIEAGTLWGQPAIKPLRLPDIIFEHSLSIFLDDLEVVLHNFDIHSEDSVCLHIPKYKLPLAGDMLEDTVPFISDPAAIPTHLNNFNLLRALDIERILPCHGRSAIIRQGGYPKELIDCVTAYLSGLYNELAQNPAGPAPELNALAGAYLAAGLIGYWQPYEAVHQENIKKLQAFFKTTAK